jgi:hypothetical protein
MSGSSARSTHTLAEISAGHLAHRSARGLQQQRLSIGFAQSQCPKRVALRWSVQASPGLAGCRTALGGAGLLIVRLRWYPNSVNKRQSSPFRVPVIFHYQSFRTHCSARFCDTHFCDHFLKGYCWQDLTPAKTHPHRHTDSGRPVGVSHWEAPAIQSSVVPQDPLPDRRVFCR